MTTIERGQFVRDLSQNRIDLANPNSSQAQALRQAGVPQADLDRIAGSDHVISGDAEYGQLYDKLVELQAQAPRTTGAQSTDRAQAVYDALRTQPNQPASTGTTASPAPISLGFGSARPRTTGIFAADLFRSRPLTLASDSQHVRTLGNSAAAQLDAAAQRNTTGPEASAQRRIRSLTDSTVTQLEGLERRRDAAPQGSAERNRLNEEIRLTVNAFENTLAQERVGLPRPNAGGSGSGGIVGALPPVLRDTVERRGVPIPGTTGGVAPRFTGTPGIDLNFRFK